MHACKQNLFVFDMWASQPCQAFSVSRTEQIEDYVTLSEVLLGDVFKKTASTRSS
jgi:hypothetical protein